MTRIIIRRGVIVREHTPVEIYEQMERRASEWGDVPWLRYAVQEGYVISAFDGQQHYVTYNTVVRLYDVSPDRCMRIRPYTSPTGHAHDMEEARRLGLILLGPDPTGAYDLDKCRRLI